MTHEGQNAAQSFRFPILIACFIVLERVCVGSMGCDICQFCTFAQQTQAQLHLADSFIVKEIIIKNENVQFKENV